jgi:hypothetical protein
MKLSRHSVLDLVPIAHALARWAKRSPWEFLPGEEVSLFTDPSKLYGIVVASHEPDKVTVLWSSGSLAVENLDFTLSRSLITRSQHPPAYVALQDIK